MSYVLGEIGFGEPFHLVARLKAENLEEYDSDSVITNTSIIQWFGLCYNSSSDIIYLSPSYSKFLASDLKCRFEYYSDANHLQVRVSNSWYVMNDSSGSFNYDSNASETAKNLTLNSNYNVDRVHAGIPYSINGLYSNVNWNVALCINERDGYNTSNSNVKGTMRVEKTPFQTKQMKSSKFDFFFIPITRNSHLPKDRHLSDLKETAITYFGKWLGRKLTTNEIAHHTIADEKVTVVFTQYHEAQQGYTYSYCSGTDTCGKCMGSCPNGGRCIVDNNTAERHSDSQDTQLTCSQDRTIAPVESHYDAPIGLIIGIILALLMFGITIFWEKKES